jgi:hypothetical protein
MKIEYHITLIYHSWAYSQRNVSQPTIEILTVMFIVAQVTIHKLGSQFRCLSTDEWIKKMLNIYIMENYSAIKKNEIV